MPEDANLLEMLVTLTNQRDAMEALLQITPATHQAEVRRILHEVLQAIEDITRALSRWTVS
jgi:hypothetical protein